MLELFIRDPETVFVKAVVAAQSLQLVLLHCAVLTQGDCPRWKDRGARQQKQQKKKLHTCQAIDDFLKGCTCGLSVSVYDQLIPGYSNRTAKQVSSTVRYANASSNLCCTASPFGLFGLE